MTQFAEHLSQEEIEKLKGELNAVKYIECSALTQVLYSHHRIRA